MLFVKKYQISEERLTDYESGILRLKPYVTDALEKGLADESLIFYLFNRRDVFFIDAYSLGSDAETGGGRRNSLFRPGG